METKTFLNDGGEIRKSFDCWVARWRSRIRDCCQEFGTKLTGDHGVGKEMIDYGGKS